MVKKISEITHISAKIYVVLTRIFLRYADVKQAKHTTKQLTEVHAKLLMLRRRIWTGLENTDNQPLSWGFSNFVSGPKNADDDQK